MSTPSTHSITDKQEVEGVVIVSGAADGFAQEVVAGSHQFRTDEPATVGGTDRGPSPYDLLLAALGILHFHDRCDVCTSKAVAVGTRHGAPSPFAGSR